MKYWIRLLALVGCVILIFALLGSVLPHGYSISVSEKIEATPAEVFSAIDKLPKWKSWSHWNSDQVESLVVEYGSDGLSQKWSDVRGSGKLWITQSEPGKRIEYEMRYASFPTMKSEIVLTPDGNSTRITWTSDGKLPSGPFYGFFRSVFAQGMEQQYKTSLLKLKDNIEKGVVNDSDQEQNLSRTGEASEPGVKAK